jgi:hypothetical protein
MKFQFGFHLLFKKKDSKIGFKTLVIGVFLEIVIGAILFLFGHLMICRKLFA